MKGKSVVVFGPSLGSYPESAAKGFRLNGMEAVSFSYPAPASNPVARLSWELMPRVGIEGIKHAWMQHIVSQVRQACETAQLLVIIKGDSLSLAQFAELLEGIRCPSVLWLMDSVCRVNDWFERASMTDLLLYFEGTDGSMLKDLAVPHHQIALAADTDWYYPMNKWNKLWDISFFGMLYDNRLSTLESIMRGLPLQNRSGARFVGPCRSRIHPIRTARRIGHYPLTAERLKHGAYWTHERINRLNNQSRICLNAFHPQSVDSLNMRTFEICSSGSFLLCQFNTALERNFVLGREVECFETPHEAAEKITFYLRNEDAAQEVADAGRRRVLRDHSMSIRVGQILALLRTEDIL